MFHRARSVKSLVRKLGSTGTSRNSYLVLKIVLLIYCTSIWLDVILIMDTRYAVIDIQDGKIVAIRKTRRAALILADKKDQAYGMYRYQVKRIENV